MPGPAARLIAETLAEAAAAGPAKVTRIVAVGWATVDLDRAVAELLRDLELPVGSFSQPVVSASLGASGLLARAAVDGRTAVAVLEPATEGRLAAVLARHGEGPAAIWFRADDHPADDAGRYRPGPLGPERALPGGPLDRVARFLLRAEPGTIGA